MFFHITYRLEDRKTQYTEHNNIHHQPTHLHPFEYICLIVMFSSVIALGMKLDHRCNCHFFLSSWRVPPPLPPPTTSFSVSIRTPSLGNEGSSRRPASSFCATPTLKVLAALKAQHTLCMDTDGSLITRIHMHACISLLLFLLDPLIFFYLFILLILLFCVLQQEERRRKLGNKYFLYIFVCIFFLKSVRQEKDDFGRIF